ncbi:MAG TPA: hypothetical protein VGP68_23335 [Gemmataceae bacterium]|nr:hypothetical protein [Gemmataceae bacterium]
MDVGNLDYLIYPRGRRLTRWKLLLLLVLVCLPLLATGCLCLSFGGSDHPESDGVLTQSGEVTCGPGRPVVVYYPIPYASPPNLEIRDCFKKCSVLEQKADCFTIAEDSPAVLRIDWTARGVRAPTTTPIAPPAPVNQAPNTAPEPLPVAPAVPGR